MKAIETRYAGCRFRSRLEARWAVFFDTLGIEWEYEPQGFQLNWRLSLHETTFNYLPDFWLPSFGVYVEVKGSLGSAECVRLLNAAASLSETGHDLLILGPIPTPQAHGFVVRPFQLHFHKGDLEGYPWPQGHLSLDVHIFARDHGDPIFVDGQTAESVSASLMHGWLRPSLNWSDYHTALTRARSARFEHGETGRRVNLGPDDVVVRVRHQGKGT